MKSLSRSRFFNDFFDEITDGFFIKPLHGDELPRQIKLDISETDTAFQVTAELPGVKKEDLHVDVNGSVVTIRAEIKQEDSSNGERNLRTERYFGSVSRSVELGQEVETDKAEASYNDGILKLALPKRQQGAGPQRLTVR